MKGTKAFCFLCMLCATVATCLRAQTPPRQTFEGWCDNLRDAKPHDLVEFLRGIRLDQNNVRCVTWAIHRLGQDRYEPAIPVLVQLLGFRRPETRRERMGFYDLAISMVPFPAIEALEQIGAKSQPEVLRAIRSESTSPQARQNAVQVLMTLNQSDHARAIAYLENEQNSSADEQTKQRLTAAIQRAVTFCTASEQDVCRKAAMATPPRE